MGGARVTLGVDPGSGLGPAPLARVRLLSPQGEAVAEGFLGLGGGPSDARGGADFDALFDGWRDAEDGLGVWVNEQTAESLGWHDYEGVARSLAAAAPLSRPPLERTLAWLRHVYQEWLPASAYGVPAADAVIAVLP